MFHANLTKFTLQFKRIASGRPTLGLALFTAFTLIGCASMGSETAQDVVRRRAAERWHAQVAGDFDRVYSYNSPGFRALVTPEKFSATFGAKGSWLAAEVAEVNCPEATKCTANVRIDLKPVFGKKYGDKISTVSSETWTLENGQWWIFQPITAK